MNTFTVLKPEQDLNTIFITQDEQTAVEAFEGSTVLYRLLKDKSQLRH
ncbi:hypothetical protein AB8I23_002571 [Vibrio alginolyticus]